MKTRSRRKILTDLLFSLQIATAAAMGQSAEPFKFFQQYVGLTGEQLSDIRNGKPIAKILESETPDEVFVFGAVYVKATPESYLKMASNVEALRRLPNYLAIQKFSEPPQLSDLDGFTLEPEDIKPLKHCKPGQCEVQLPAALEALRRYQEGGNTALGTYRDKNHPAAVGDTFQSLLGRSKALPVYLPDLNHYLLDYPKVSSETIQSEFYWEKVNFGLKPTLRILQAVVYRGSDPTGPA